MSTETTTAPIAPATALAVTPAALVASVTKSAVPSAKVHVVTPEGADSPIVPYKNGTDGYMQLKAETIQFGASWSRTVKRSCLLKGKVTTLEAILKQHVNPKDMSIPGKLVVREFVYNDDFQTLPEFKEYNGRLDADEEDEETRINSYVKRAGAGEAPMLTVGEAPILRFTDYLHPENPEFATATDVFVQHDNLDEVAEYRAASKATA